MKHRKWKIRSLGLLLLMVLLTDGALAGTAFAVARHLEVRTDAWQPAPGRALWPPSFARWQVRCCPAI